MAFIISKGSLMDKLLELEKKLKEARAMLEKAEEKKDKKHPDEKEDKKLIAEALDTHNEKKHGEAKDKDSAFKDEKIEKSYQLGSIFEDDFEKSNSTTDKAQRIAPGARQPAYVRGVFGEASKTAKVIDSIVSPNEQVKAQKDKAAQNKATAEAAAKERRAQYRKEGILKGDDEIETEVIKFDKNGQWKL